ncbi:solute carrier family 25 member 35-like isoform X2 [Cydia pomonella]|uniref:solute carrier family 25 member 35-like isoform X2 n=1 Tax=Cydia pomonella TaxID=82600 RepID=UPI002ADE2E63|nr:solute carrier family 25 member 35-like isoform X2 [Cydia pomonella]
MDFVIGGLAGAGATVFTNPIDVVKTRLQLQGELQRKDQQVVRYRGMLHAIFVIGRTDGVFALQKGLAPALVLGFTMNSVRLGLYHISEVRGWTSTDTGEVSISKAVFWSSVSGIVSGVVGNPVSVLKTRIQASSHPSIAVGRQHRYKGMFDGMSKIYSSEGFKGYFAGVNAACARLAVGSAAQLTTFSKAKQELEARGIGKDPVTRALLASFVSSFFVVMLETPFDVVNTRIYNQGTAATGGLLYTGVFDALCKIYKTEGLHGLYKGLGPLYIRITPHTTLSLVIWDMLNLYMSDKSS